MSQSAATVFPGSPGGANDKAGAAGWEKVRTDRMVIVLWPFQLDAVCLRGQFRLQTFGVFPVPSLDDTCAC